jgi:uncharacterized protein YndB with AHSA1/START domain
MAGQDERDESNGTKEMRREANTDTEVVTSRVIAATRDHVFAAWTDPSILACWWGPNGFTNSFHTFDLKPEGLWEFTMHAPDGSDFNNTCVFKHIEAPTYLEFDHLKDMHFYKAMVSFAEDPAGTRIEWTMRFGTVEELRPIRNFIEQANEENLDRLEHQLNGNEP